MLCRNKHDQVAFAVHAFMLADGYKLVATGKKADEANEGEPFTSYSAVKSSGNRLPIIKQCIPARSAARRRHGGRPRGLERRAARHLCIPIRRHHRRARPALLQHGPAPCQRRA